MSDANSISFHVGFLCKLCSIVFKSVEVYLSHKAEFHFNTQLAKSRPSCIVFEESILEPTEEELTNFWKAVVPSPVPVPVPIPIPVPVSDETQELIANKLKDSTRIGVKQESPEHIFTSEEVNSSLTKDPVSLLELTYGEPTSNSEIKTEWVEENTVTIIKCDTSQNQQQENDYLVPCDTVNSDLKSQRIYETNNYYYDNDNQSSFISSDADVDQLENFNVTQSTTTFPTAETELEYSVNENAGDDDSDTDVICLDDPLPSPPPPPPPPTSAPNKIPPLKIVPPTAAASPSTSTVTTTRLNSLILSQLKLECQICYKKFESSAQLRIHVTICQLYNGKTKKSSAGGGPGPGQPQDVLSRSRIRSRSRGHSKAKVMGSGLNGCRSFVTFVKCDECLKEIRPSKLASHLRTEHRIFVQDSERKYVCNICGSAFQNSTYLNGHLMVHSNARPFVCSVPGCYHAFKYERNLRQHMKTAHPHLSLD